MKVAIVGSRGWTDEAAVVDFVHRLHAGDTVISSGARGVDTFAAKAAILRGDLRLRVIKPDWERYGRKAGMMRNTQIADECDRLIAFWDGVSRGTKDSIDKATKAGKSVEIHYADGVVERGGGS